MKLLSMLSALSQFGYSYSASQTVNLQKSTINQGDLWTDIDTINYYRCHHHRQYYPRYASGYSVLFSI